MINYIKLRKNLEYKQKLKGKPVTLFFITGIYIEILGKPLNNYSFISDAVVRDLCLSTGIKIIFHKERRWK